MKFYSYTNNNCNYTKAISLQNIRALSLVNGEGKSAIRFSVRIEYIDGKCELFNWLEAEEARKVYEKILDLLNKKA